MSSEDEDWFDRALQEEDEAGDSRTDEEDSDGDSGTPDDDVDGIPDELGEASETTSETSEGIAGMTQEPPAEGEEKDAGLFEDDFASALDEAPAGEPSGSDAIDGGGVEMDDAFGMGADDEFDIGGEDFGGESDTFGMGGFGGEGPDFEPEEVESDIPRIDLGIKGLDDMIQGGVPERALMVAIGSAGTGKTTFGLQFLNKGLQQDHNAVFVALEESRDRIINSAEEKGMPFEQYVEDGHLAILDIDPIEMANSLQSIQNELPRLIQEFGATRLVLDSVSLLEMMYQDRSRRRNDIFDFTKSLKNAGITTMLTSEADADNPYASRYGIVEYLTDAVFVLQYVRPSDFRETRLAIEIQKIRDANHSRETKPYEITNDGISVYRQANIF